MNHNSTGTLLSLRHNNLTWWFFYQTLAYFQARKLSSNLETSLLIIYYHQLINRTALSHKHSNTPISPSLFLLQATAVFHPLVSHIQSYPYSAWSRSNYLKHHCDQGIPLHKTFPWFSLVLSRKPGLLCPSRVCFPLLTSSGLFLFSAFRHLLRSTPFYLKAFSHGDSPSFQLTYVHNWFLLSLHTSEKSFYSSMTTHPDQKPC